MKEDPNMIREGFDEGEYSNVSVHDAALLDNIPQDSIEGHDLMVTHQNVNEGFKTGII